MKNPWLALSTYEEKDKFRFKGRDKDTEAMLTMLQQNESVVCYAASGDGKSSLINAGICPKVRQLGLFPVKIIFTSDEYASKNVPDFDKLILDKINNCIKLYAKQYGYELEDCKFIQEEYFQDVSEQVAKFIQKEDSQDVNKPATVPLWWKLRTERLRIRATYYIPVLIFDQFEEIFRAKWKQQFFTWLEMLMRDVCPDDIAKELAKKQISYDRLPQTKLFKALFSLRYEYIGELDYWCSQKSYIPLLMRNRYFLRPLTRAQAMEVLSNQSLDVDDDNASKALKKIKDGSEIITKKILGTMFEQGEGDEAPAIIVSLVAYVLFEECCKNPDCDINLLNYNDIIYNYYLSKLSELNISGRKQYVLEDVLIDQDKTRLRVATSDTRLKGIDIDGLAKAHILKIDTFDTNDANEKKKKYVAFVHDRLALAVAEKLEHRKVAELRSKVLIAGVLAVLALALFVGYRGVDLNNRGYLVDMSNSLTTDTASFSSMDYPFVQTLNLTNRSNYEVYVDSRGQLSELSVSGDKSIKLKVSGEINQLKRISVGKGVEELALISRYTNDTINNLTIELAECTKTFTFDNSHVVKNIDFKIPPTNSNLLWRDNVLWDLKNKQMLFTTKNDSVTYVPFPEGFDNQDSLCLNGVTLKPQKYSDDCQWSDSVIDKKQVVRHLSRKVQITDKVKVIDEGAFAGLDSLVEVVFDGDCQTLIRPRAFADCRNLKKVTFARGCSLLRYSNRWPDNIFSECLKIEEINLVGKEDSEKEYRYISENGAIYRVDRANSNKKEPCLFTNKATGVSLSYYVPEAPDTSTDPIRCKWENGIFYNLSSGFVCVRSSCERLTLSTAEWCNSTVFQLHIIGEHVQDVKEVEFKFSSPYYRLKQYLLPIRVKFYDNQESLLRTIIVPYGTGDLFAKSNNFQDYNIIESGLLKRLSWGWEAIISNVSGYIKGFPLIGLLLLAGLLVLSCFVWLFFKRWGLSLLIVFLSVCLWVVVYWLCFLAIFPKNQVIGSVVATLLTVAVAYACIRLFNSSAEKLFNWKRQFTRSYLKESLRALKAEITEAWHKYREVITAIAVLSGIIVCCMWWGKTWRANNDLDKMVAEENWERVSKIVYDRLMACDSIDAMTYSWAQSLLNMANGNNVLSGVYVSDVHDYADGGIAFLDSAGHVQYVDARRSQHFRSSNQSRSWFSRHGDWMIYEAPRGHLLYIESISGSANPFCVDSVWKYRLIGERWLLIDRYGSTEDMVYDLKTKSRNDAMLPILSPFLTLYGFCDDGKGKMAVMEGDSLVIYEANSLPIKKEKFGVGLGYKINGWLGGKIHLVEQEGNHLPHLFVDPISSRIDSLSSIASASYKARGFSVIYTDSTSNNVFCYDIENRKSTLLGKKEDEWDYINDSTFFFCPEEFKTCSFYRVGKEGCRPIKELVLPERNLGFRNLCLDLFRDGKYIVKEGEDWVIRALMDNKECKRMPVGVLDYDCCSGNFLYRSTDKTTASLVPLNGTPPNVYYTLQSKLDGDNQLLYLQDAIIVKIEYAISVGGIVVHIPSLKEAVRDNRGLTTRQKEKLLKRLDTIKVK